MFEEFLLEGVKIDGEVYDDYVEEGIAPATSNRVLLGAILGGAILVGTFVAIGQVNKQKGRSYMKDVKHAIAVYEKYCSPKVKLSDLKKKSYNLDDKTFENSGERVGAIVNIINHGKLAYTTWMDGDTVVCGFGWPVNPKTGTSIKSKITVYVNPKYKKDSDYLVAAMAYNVGCEVADTDKFVKAMKKYDSVTESVMLEAMKYI